MISENLRTISLDTAIVAFLLAIELGRSASLMSIDSALIALTLAGVVILPFFLIADGPSLLRWLAGRFVVLTFGLIVGATLTESARFVPMSLLIIAALASCSIQFYSVFKLRLAD